MTSLKHSICGLSLFACVCVPAGQSWASQLVFTGQNAALFSTANPLDTAALMNSVHKPVEKSTTSTSTLVQQAVVSQIGSKIYNDIFNGTGLSGFYDLGGGNTISYVRSGGYITITIVNASTGSTTITVPDT